MGGSVGGGGGTDISSLGIADDNQPLSLTVVYSLFIHFQPLNAKLLVHGNLRLYGRDQIVCSVHNCFVKFPDGICRPFQSLAVPVKRLLQQILG